MTKEEIIFWRDRYDKEEDLYNQGLEKELRKKFQKYDQATKLDLIRIIKWKFQGRLLGRQKRILNLFKTVKNSTVKEKSRLAFKAKDDEERLRLLSSKKMRGIGNALSSVILAFYDPQNYGILDIHAWRGLFGEKEPSDISSNPETAIEFFNKLREISSRTDLPCRDIEKAYFKKDLEISKKGNRTRKKSVKKSKNWKPKRKWIESVTINLKTGKSKYKYFTPKTLEEEKRLEDEFDEKMKRIFETLFPNGI